MQPDSAASHQWDTLQAQIAQGMIEHEAVMQALRAQAIVSAMFILTLGSLCFALWRRHACLFEALVAEIKRHSNERIVLVKQHSLERSSELMQMLHAFEGIVSRARQTSAPSHLSSALATPPQQPSTGTPPPLPIPPPVPIRRK